MEIVNALVRNQIDLKGAQLVLRALYIAVKNSGRVHFESQSTTWSPKFRSIQRFPSPSRPTPPFSKPHFSVNGSAARPAIGD
jgi:hypothetical protein